VGHACLDAVPSAHLPIGFATVTDPEPRDIKVLEDYIVLKEKHIARNQNVEKNIEVVEQTEWLISYLKEFPTKDHMEVIQSPFWPLEEGITNEVSIEGVLSGNVVDESIFIHLPPVVVDAYWGPKSMKPSRQRIRQQVLRPNRANNTSRRGRGHIQSTLQYRHGMTSNYQNDNRGNRTVSGNQGSHPFPAFDPRQDVRSGMFVGIEIGEEDQLKGIPFFIAKVIDMERQASEDGTFTVLWYEPRMRRGEVDNAGEFHRRYCSSINKSWVPSREPNDTIPVDTVIIAWTNTGGLSNIMTVNGVRTEKQIVVPTSQHLQHINWATQEAN
jgi:hypothetical protein